MNDMLSHNREDDFVWEELFFTFFIHILNTRLVRLSDDKAALLDINSPLLKKYKKGSLEERYLNWDHHHAFSYHTFWNNVERELYRFFYTIVSYCEEGKYVEIQTDIHKREFKNHISQSSIVNIYTKKLYDILFCREKIIFHQLSFFQKLFYLTIHLEEIQEKISIIWEKLSEKNLFYCSMLQFVDTSFYHIDHLSSYKHLVTACSIYPFFSQIYALKVRSLYFIWFNSEQVEKQAHIRKEMMTKENAVYQRIQENIKLSHTYFPNNKGIFIFELALYLHCHNWKAVGFFLKNYSRRKEFFYSQRATIYLWIWKFFFRKGYYKQAKYYLCENILWKWKEIKFAIHKARFFLAIVQKNYTLFDEELSFFEEIWYKKFIYYDGPHREIILQDNDIILPLQSKVIDRLLIENIDVKSLLENEKWWYTSFVLLLQKNYGL